MCSNPAQRIADIGQAIEDLAAEALAAYAPAARRPALPTSAADQVVIRLAALWAQLADLDPEVARRLPTYEA